MNEMLFIGICLVKAELLYNHFLNHCSYIIVPYWVGHLLFFINICEKRECTCSLMPLLLKLHFHAKSVWYFSNGRYKLVTLSIQWTRSNWHKESFRVRTTNTVVNFLEESYIEFWLFSLLIAFPDRLLYIA